jgi:protein-disulfide isomerase
MFMRFLGLALFAALLLPATGHAAAFTPQQREEIVGILRDALKRDPSILRDAVIALQADDARQQNQAQAGALKTLEPQLAHAPGDPVAGNPNGRITVVEFYDVRCPYCRRMLPTMASLLRNNPDIRLVYKDLPVLGPASVLGARALLAAQKQNAYMPMHDAIMAGPPDVTEDSLRTMTSKLGINWDRLQADMKSPDVLARIDANLAMARKLELQGTPVYVVGTTLLPGAVDLAELQQAVTTARKIN